MTIKPISIASCSTEKDLSETGSLCLKLEEIDEKTDNVAVEKFNKRKRDIKKRMLSTSFPPANSTMQSIQISFKKRIKAEGLEKIRLQVVPQNGIEFLKLKIKDLLLQRKDKAQAAKQRRWMKNSVTFLGLTKPQQQKLVKQFIAEFSDSLNGLSSNEIQILLNSLWQENEREFHYTAIDLAKHFIKKWTPQFITTFEYMIRNYSWWDTIDDIAPNLIGHLVKVNPHLMTKMDEWILDENLWVRRTAILFQLKWHQDTDTNRLENYCLKTMHETEFFIAKALGWMLREYTKFNPKFVQGLCKKYKDELQPLTIREGMKYIKS